MVVSERLGHATVSITLDTYSHVIPAMQEEAAAKIAELVFAAKWPHMSAEMSAWRRWQQLCVRWESAKCSEEVLEAAAGVEPAMEVLR
jgi:hypothetical protein